MYKKVIPVLICIVLLLSLIITSCSSNEIVTTTTTTAQPATSTVTTTTIPATPTTTPAPTTRLITDLAGRTVEVPLEINRIATFVGPSYDKVFMLGAKDKIVMVGMTQSPWAQLLNPEIANVLKPANAQDPNIEELIKQQVDVVFTWDTADPLEKMSNAGISALASLASSSKPNSAAEYITAMKKEVYLYADVLGTNAQERAKKYCEYLDSVVKRVTSVTSKLSDSEIPDVYYIRGPKILSTHGKYSNTRWYVEIAGGNLVSKDLEQLISEVNIEQIMEWDPDIIMMGRLDSTDLVMNDPNWSVIKAVKNGDVYVNPYGVFYWDYGIEGALFMLDLAKTFHPDLFADVDMVKEVKYFYSEFYNFQLTDEQATKILNNQKP